MVHSLIKNSTRAVSAVGTKVAAKARRFSPLLFALCAGCGAEDMGPLDGEEGVDSVQEALGGNWMLGTGTDMVHFFGGPAVCEHKRTFPVTTWYPGFLSGDGSTCFYKDVFGASQVGFSGFKSLRTGSYALQWSGVSPAPTSALRVTSDSPGQLSVCIALDANTGPNGRAGYVQSGKCTWNSGPAASNFYWVIFGA